MFSTLDCSPMGKGVWGGERKEIKREFVAQAGNHAQPPE